MRADVIVVGLGSMGSAAAYALASRGLRVVGLDRFTPPHDRGAHAGGSRIIRMAYMEGADLRTGVAVENWHADESGVIVTTADGVLEADRLVLAPGAWAPGLTRLPVSLRVERRVQHYWRASRPELFSVGRLPVWIWEYGPNRSAYGLPEVDGGVKAALHHGQEAADPAVGAAPVRTQEIAAMPTWLAPNPPTPAPGRWVGS